MQELIQCFENKVVIPNFKERGITLQLANQIIYGAPHCGKSYLIFDLLERQRDKKSLYIDLLDLRINKYEIFNNLDMFLDEFNLEILVIENYHKDYIDISQYTHKIDTIILSSTINFKLDNFINIWVKPLRFEEFLLFETNFTNITNSFNLFLKQGNLPSNQKQNEGERLHTMQLLVKNITTNQTELKILIELFKNSGEFKSLLQLYNKLKNTTKISKDKFYQYCKYLQDSNIIFLIPKLNQPKAAKRLFSYNFIYYDIVNYKKNFNNTFSNIVFCEFLDPCNIYYIDNTIFYHQKKSKLIIALPFFDDLSVNYKKDLSRIIEKYNIKDVEIVTVSNEFDFILLDIPCSVRPFYIWSMQQ